jgi:hypothetical protein
VNDSDLNLEPIEYALEKAQNISAFGSHQHAHLDVENGFDIQGLLYSLKIMHRGEP